MKTYLFALLACCGIGLETAWAAPFVPVRDAQCVAFSTDGRFVATGISGMSDQQFPPRPHPSPRKCGVVQLYDVKTRARLRRIETYGDLTRVRFSSDGKWLAFSRLYKTADGVELNAVGLCDLNNPKSVYYFDRCHGFDFSPNGSRIAVLSRTRCILFDTSTRTKIREFVALSRAVCVRFSPDGGLLAGIVPEDETSKIKICDAAKTDVVATSAGLAEPFYSLTFSPNGDALASGHVGGMVVIWDTVNLQAIAKLNLGAKAIAQPFFSPTGEILGAGDQNNGDVVFWDLSSGKELRRYTFKQGTFRTYARHPLDERRRPETDPERFVFSPDGAAFLAGCYGGMIRTLSDGRDLRSFGE